MRNAWTIMRFKTVKNFAAALRKAWFNEKRAWIHAMIEGVALVDAVTSAQPTADNATFTAGCLAFYADARQGTYFGD